MIGQTPSSSNIAPIWDLNQPNTQQTHALILGVGKYQHLNGSNGRLTQRNMGLGQLTSPPVSARKFAEWVTQDYNNIDAPLGSVYMLLSEQPSTPFPLPDGSSSNVASATIDNIEDAFDAWLNRLKQHPDNQAIFYYCGHGVLIQGDLILLAEDYGEKDHQPFDGSINFEELQKGMANQHQGMQCHFIDTCSNYPVDNLPVLQSGARIFITVTAPPSSNQTMLVLRASAPGNSAYGIPYKESRFTGAILDSLMGRGVNQTQIGGEWVVTTNSLVYSVNQIIDWLNKNEFGPEQIPNVTRNTGVGSLHYLSQSPIIPVEVKLDPEYAIDDADLTLESHETSFSKSRQAQQGTWEPSDVRAGLYTLKADFRSLTFQNLNKNLFVVPPGPMDEPFVLETR